jgi:general L-amino acid transport system permease protein
MIPPNPVRSENGAPLGRGVQWLQRNLFNTWYNCLLTVLALWVIYRALTGVLRWGIATAASGTTPADCEGASGACWAFIAGNWHLFMFGTYPFEERWRPVLAAGLLAALALLGVRRGIRASRTYRVFWLIGLLVIFVLIRGTGSANLTTIDTSFWGGLMLTLLMASTGMIFALPLGILLALGRQSETLPLVRAVSVAYIEVIRGVPLISILFMASVMLPLFFPAGLTLDKLLRAQIGLVLFNAAYIAEVVRGGLQAIPRGQYDAAHALGMNYLQVTGLVILPQALRTVIPSLVGQLISLLKDTSLVTIIGLLDLVAIPNVATSNPAWLGNVTEGYVFVALVYWVLCFSMSRYARRLETRLGVGRR